MSSFSRYSRRFMARILFTPPVSFSPSSLYLVALDVLTELGSMPRDERFQRRNDASDTTYTHKDHFRAQAPFLFSFGFSSLSSTENPHLSPSWRFMHRRGFIEAIGFGLPVCLPWDWKGFD